MHKPIIIEQKNNIILNNVDEISKDLNRDLKLILNFLKNKFILPKTTTNGQILNSLYVFIEKIFYVLNVNYQKLF